MLVSLFSIYGCRLFCVMKSASPISMTMIHIWTFTALVYFIVAILIWLMVIYQAKNLTFSEPEYEYRFYMITFFTWSFFIWIPSFVGWYFYFFAEIYIVWVFIGVLFGWIGVSLLAFAMHSLFNLPRKNKVNE